MSDNIALHCPKCGKSAFQSPDNPDLEKSFTCASCGAVIKMGELKTASGKRLLDHAADLIRDKLKGIKGFKPK